MGLTLKKMRDQVIVITGTSSGIGLTTAEMAAEAGARVVLNSRNEADLRAAVERIRRRGGRAIYVVGGVADPDAMEDVANRAIEEFGGSDTWVNIEACSEGLHRHASDGARGTGDPNFGTAREATLIGRVRPAPDADEAMRHWNIDAATARSLQARGTYVHVTEIRESGISGKVEKSLK